MKNLKSFCLSLFVAGATAAGVNAAPLRTDINPALLYFQAVQLAPDLSQSERSYLFDTEWRGQSLPTRFGELVQRYNNQFDLVRQAAQTTAACDWGIDWSKGPETLVPHLGRNKAMAQTARLRAMWFLQNGRQAEATEDLLAALALARNCSRDGSLIAVLVQIAAEDIFASTVLENFSLLSPENLKRLAEGLKAAPARGTVASCIAVEKISFPEWIVAQVQAYQKENPGNDAKVMERIHEKMVTLFLSGEGGQSDASFWPRVLSASGGNSDGVLKLVHQVEPLYPKLTEILALPRLQLEAQLQQFMADVRKSPNPFITELFPAWEKCPPKEFAALTGLAMVSAAIEYKLHGEAGLKSVTDPCGSGPFALERFAFDGEDRGFQLKGAYTGRGFQEVMIFVEKDGPMFKLNGKAVGQKMPGRAGVKMIP